MHLFWRMTFVCFEELRRRLAIIIALAFVGCLKDGVANQTYVEVTFLLWAVCDLAEGVKRHDSFLVSLFAAEDVVDPGVQVVGNVLRLDSFSHYLDELESILVGPARKDHV